MAIVYGKDKQNIELDLNGPQGNAFCLLGHAQKFGNQLNMDNIDEIMSDMQSGDYEHLVEVFDYWFGEFVTLIR